SEVFDFNRREDHLHVSAQSAETETGRKAPALGWIYRIVQGIVDQRRSNRARTDIRLAKTHKDIVFRIGILIRRRIDNLCSAGAVTESYAREARILQILVPCEIGQGSAQAHAETGSVLSKERISYKLV